MELENVYNYLIERTHRRMRQYSQQKFYENGIDLTIDQWVVLYYVSGHKGSNQTEIAFHTLKDTPTVTRIIDLLVKKGYLERQVSEEDRRSFKIYLTNKGLKIKKKALPLVYSIRAKGWIKLTEKDFKDFSRIINTIYSNFE